MINAIPTKYKNIQFRSRLEAKWAAFFDLLNWRYDYEPIDLNGYIPDFILDFHKPLLVEVKPILVFNEFEQHTKKIEQSGWTNESLIVGAKLFNERYWDETPTIGLLDEGNLIALCPAADESRCKGKLCPTVSDFLKQNEGDRKYNPIISCRERCDRGAGFIRVEGMCPATEEHRCYNECVSDCEIKDGNKVIVTDKMEHGWSEGCLFWCSGCKSFSIYHLNGSWTCRKCGYHAGNEGRGSAKNASVNLWSEAGNVTQWRSTEQE